MLKLKEEERISQSGDMWVEVVDCIKMLPAPRGGHQHSPEIEKIY